MRTITGPCLLVAAALLASTGCGAAGHSSTRSAEIGAPEAAQAPARPPAGTAAGGSPAGILFAPRALARTAEVTLTVHAIGPARDGVVKAAAEHGGDLYAEQGDERQHTVTVKVPTAAFAATMLALDRIGRQTSVSTSTDDRTEQVVDVGARVRNAQAAVGDLQRYLSSARDITEVVKLEDALTTREADLESLQAQQRTLSGQTSLATITAQLVLPDVVPRPGRHHATSVLGALRSGWHAFGAAAHGVAVGLATALPFGLLAAGSGLLALLVRRWRRSRPAPAA